MLQSLEWEEDEALTMKRVPQPVAEAARTLRPRITILGMPAVAAPGQHTLDWDDHEGKTQKCTPFYDEQEDLPSWEDEKTLPDLSALRGDEPQIAVKEVELDSRELAPYASHPTQYPTQHPTQYPSQYPTYPPPAPPQLGSVPPMALDPEPRPQGSGWSKLAAATSGLVLLCLAAMVAFFLVPRTGTLRVELEHDGIAPTRAEIYVDGQKRCDIDPCVVSDLEPGTRSIKVLVAGAETAVESEGDVARGETRVVTVRVSFAQGLRARARRKGVRVWVDGEKRGTLPIELSDLAPGTHQLRFEAGDRFGEVTRSVEVQAGRVVDLGEIDLEVRKVGLQIELGTPDVKVQLVDPQGKVSTVAGPFPAKLDLSPGRYRLVGSKPGYAPQAETLELGKEPTHTIRLELSPQRFRPRAPVLSLEDLLRILPPPSEVPDDAEEPDEPLPPPPPSDVIEGTTET